MRIDSGVLVWCSDHIPAESGGVAWLQRQSEASVQPLLSTPWIWDFDVTVQSLYGKQEGTEIGYNPKKLDRPSRAYFTHRMSELRFNSRVDVESGNQSIAIHTLPGILHRCDARYDPFVEHHIAE